MASDTRPLYAVLGVAADAEPEAIKKAYRRLALQHHPDRQLDAAEPDDVFARIAFAYEVLGHPQRRKRYDLTGEVPQSDTALGRRAAETFLAEYVRSAPKVARGVTQADMSLHSLENYEVLEVDGRDVPEYMRGIVMRGLSYLAAVVDAMEDKEVVLLRHYVMDQMYALLAYAPPLDEGAFAERGYIITYYDHPLQAGIQSSWSDQNDAKARKAGVVAADVSRLRLIDASTVEQRRLVALEWRGAPAVPSGGPQAAPPAKIPGTGWAEERLRLGIRALLQTGADLECRTIHQLRRDLEGVLDLEAHALDKAGATQLMSIVFEEMAQEGEVVAAEPQSHDAVRAQPPVEAAPPAVVDGGLWKDRRVRVRACGRAGTVLLHDPADADMMYKVRFDDGSPDDWFGRGAVEAA